MKAPQSVGGRERHLDNTALIVVILLVLDSLHLVFGRLLLPYMPPTTSSFYVLVIGTIEVAIVLKLWGQIQLDVLRGRLWFFLSMGFLVGTSTVLSFMSVEILVSSRDWV